METEKEFKNNPWGKTGAVDGEKDSQRSIWDSRRGKKHRRGHVRGEVELNIYINDEMRIDIGPLSTTRWD